MLAALILVSAAERVDPPIVDFPYPLITEILYNVPTRDGDANADGERQVTGDEFVELVNPHDKPIALGGYTLRDRNAEDMGQMKFVFPEMTLEPGEVVVVFNGHDQKWRDPAGTSKEAPRGHHPQFDDAFVLTMETKSSRTALANGGDYVLLSAPNGQRVHLVHWGEFDEELPEVKVVEEVDDVRRGSAARADVSSPMTSHTSLLELSFSPGRFPHMAPSP